MQTEEHWNTKGDRLLGLYRVDAAKATGDLWQRIDQIVYEWAALHPVEMADAVAAAKAEREAAISQYALSEGKTVRKGAKIPPGLLFALQATEPRLFEDKDLFHGFIKRYHGLRTCQVV